MPARRRRPSASFTTPASPTRSARSMRAPRRWTGWSRSRSAGSRSRQRGDHLFLERPSDQHHRHARPRRLHDRGRALAARARRRGRGVRRRRRRRAAVRDRLAPGRQIQGPADVLRQQARPHRRQFRNVRRDDQGPARRPPDGDAAADRHRVRASPASSTWSRITPSSGSRRASARSSRSATSPTR